MYFSEEIEQHENPEAAESENEVIDLIDDSEEEVEEDDEEMEEEEEEEKAGE